MLLQFCARSRTGSDVMIDEVGYLESSCARYAKELERLFDRCTVIAALRKDHTPLLDRLRSRPDVFVWDLICTSTPVRWAVW